LTVSPTLFLDQLEQEKLQEKKSAEPNFLLNFIYLETDHICRTKLNFSSISINFYTWPNELAAVPAHATDVVNSWKVDTTFKL
jgi:hypothetical protein